MLALGVLVTVLIGLTVTGSVSPEPAGSTPAAGDQIPLVVGAVPYWDEQEARDTLETHSDQIDVASPWSYAVTADGSVQLQPDLQPASEQALTARLHELGIKVIPTVANTTAGLWNSATVSKVINDPALRRVHIQSIVSLIESAGFDGIQIDYEELAADDRASFSAFVTDLAEAVHQVAKVLYVTVHVKEDDAGYDARNRSQDYAAIGKAADKVCLMAYDWHWSTGPSGPIAPYDWVQRVLTYSVTQIPADKILLGVGLFGYDWVGTTATSLTWRQVVALAGQYRVDEAWDVGAQSPHFSYTVQGVNHEVWYENSRSAAAKFDLARDYRLGGVELWRLGGEDPAVWEPGP
ncbi:MAG TPA: glycosyl hydrolase family 18 protein [Nakamurella sp.]